MGMIDDDDIGGMIVPATREGLVKLLRRANQRLDDGFELSHIVRLKEGGEEYLGAVFQRRGRSTTSPGRSSGSLV